MKLIFFLFLASAALFNSSRAQSAAEDMEHYGHGNHDATFDHEAFLGHDDAEASNQLTVEQAKKKLAMMVPRIDKDGDGEITEEELKKHLQYMLQRYIDKDVDRTWQAFDKEHTVGDRLSWENYVDRFYGKDIENLAMAYQRKLKRDERRWKKADLNGDNILEKADFICFQHPEDCGSMRDIVGMETLEDLDKDEDGYVTAQEFIDDMFHEEHYPDLKPGEEPEWVQSERQMFAEHRDKNNDGKMDLEEVKEWIMPSGYDPSAAEASHLIHMADDDKDLKLSLDEILAHYDVFSGSQATDYGKQLEKHDPAEL